MVIQVISALLAPNQECVSCALKMKNNLEVPGGKKQIPFLNNCSLIDIAVKVGIDVEPLRDSGGSRMTTSGGANQ